MRLFTNPRQVSDVWLRDHRLTSSRTGWDGPRWRSPKELEELRLSMENKRDEVRDRAD